ncbi:ATP-binding cassette domain-containing protein [Mucilaginibacter glaciei]|uniref:ATP-binding cassette domain-containing protein n=1 Tax=Mucilaginibacter glaciei TaxID=2772109 RepID=A0A926NMQ7_9SPHI|nr:ATP-binding cassette domain-containing protein [Mucilaginibacter glaciei]MBD1391742.1 ATP-binding cassette domain-containing protein [Mucilaginibacter glaciei]
MTPLLFSAEHIAVKFANNPLFQDMDFAVLKGEHWAITGKSGSGKSVLLQIISGNQGVNGGKINYHFMNDIKLETAAPLTFHRFIAFAGARHRFKNLSNTGDLYYQQRYNSSDSEDALTVSDYLHNIKPNSYSPLYWTFEKTVAALNLTELIDKQTIKLSNGETKRLMIAAALLKNPLLLLLDNPMTGLDVQTRKSFNLLLTEIAESGITLIMASSNSELPDVITNVAVLEDGDITESLTRQQFDASDHKNNSTPLINKLALQELVENQQSLYKSIISMDDVVIKYGEKKVLNHINWRVKPGDRWALLGPNGAGKSTLLSLVNGDNPHAYANDIVLFDKKRGTGESIWDIKSKIGFVSPELYQYFPTDNSCLQVIESGFYDTLGLFRQSSKTKADLALKWMKALEIDQYALTVLKNIPASAQRLCLLARALIKTPTLLLFDEPCQGLDDHQQQHFKAVVDTICELSPVTLIYVTHYQHEIPDSVDKVLKLDKGAVVV